MTGTSDLTPVRAQLELLKEIVPERDRVGVVYNAGEVNSVVQVEIARQAAAELGLTLVEATAGNSSEVLQAAQSLQGRVDAIYVPTDNTVVSAIESVVLVAERAKLPLIAGEADSVEKGALATIGIDYYQLGPADGGHRSPGAARRRSCRDFHRVPGGAKRRRQPGRRSKDERRPSPTRSWPRRSQILE